jgi:hypothetical protein
VATKTKTKKAASKAAPKAAPIVEYESIRLDPDLPLVPGNSVTFVARPAAGRASVKISTDRGDWMGAPSSTPSGVRQSKILEPGPISVTFYEEGEPYAQGSWEV